MLTSIATESAATSSSACRADPRPPPDTADRLVDTALAVCGTDATDMFTNGLDLILRGCDTDRKSNQRARSRRS